MLLEDQKHTFLYFLLENNFIDQRYLKLLEYYVSEATIDDLLSVSTRDRRANNFSLSDVRLKSIDFSKKILNFEFQGSTDTYKTKLQLLDWSTISRLKGADIDKIELALDGEIKVGCSCFTGDTKVKLLNGNDIRIDELPTNEYFWVYGTNENGKLIPTKAKSLGETKKVKKLVKVILDNNEEVRCTPDHLFMLRNGEYKQAQYLTKNDSLMPQYFHYTEKGYEKIWLNDEKRYTNTYFYIAKYFKRGKFRYLWDRIKGGFDKRNKRVHVHHVNEIKKDNRPENLYVCGSYDHWMFHAKRAKYRGSEWVKRPENKEKVRENCKKANKVSREKHGEKHIKNLRNGWRNWVDGGEGREFYKQHFSKMVNDPEILKQKQEQGRKRMKRLWNDPEWAEKKKESQKEVGREVLNKPENQKIMIQGRVLSVFKKIEDSGEEINFNNFKKYKSRSSPYPETIFGSWENAFEAYKNYNHSIKKVEFIEMDDYIPVYDINVPETNNFLLSSGVYVHNCPDYRYRYRYVATQYDAAIKSESRPTDITNPDYDGAICKHLHFVLENIEEFKDRISKLRREEREKQKKRDLRKKERKKQT